MAKLLDGWFADRAPGQGKAVYSSGTIVGHVGGPLGVGTGQVAQPSSYPALPSAGTVIPAPGTSRSTFFNSTYPVFRNAVGFDGSTMVYGLPTPADSTSFTLSLWANFGEDLSFHFIPKPNQGAFFDTNMLSTLVYGTSLLAPVESGSSLSISPGLVDDQRGNVIYTAFGIPVNGANWNMTGPNIDSFQGSIFSYSLDGINDIDFAYKGVSYPSNGTTGAGWFNLLFACHGSGGTVLATCYINEMPIFVEQDLQISNITFSQADFNPQGATFNDGDGIFDTPNGQHYQQRNNIGGRHRHTGSGYQTSTPSGDGLCCAVAEYWAARGQWVDIRSASNRAKFHCTSLTGDVYCPVNLGSTGATPTGSAPTVYCGGGANLFYKNRVSGASMNVFGTLFDIDQPPSAS